MIEDRLIEIETKISFQEDLLQELNNVVCRQQKQIDQLEAVCKSLIDHVRALSEAASEGKSEGGMLNERPPHY
jgi:SlyX protein